MTVKTDRLENQDGSKGVAVDTVIEGSEKAWCNFNGTGTIAIRDSFNISSLVDNGTGQYHENFTNSFANSDYCFTGSSVAGISNFGISTSDELTNRTVSRTGIHYTMNGINSNAASDMVSVNMKILGELT